MSWGSDFPLFDLAQQLMETRLRAERLRLAQKVQQLENRARAQGTPTLPLTKLRHSLSQPLTLRVEKPDSSLRVPSKSPGRWRKRYLVVDVKAGSVF